MQNMNTNRAENLSPLPGPLFYSTQIPAASGYSRKKDADAKRGFRHPHQMENQLLLAA